MIRVVIVDDEAILRSGLELIIASAGDLEVVGSCSGVDAIHTIRETSPDVVLLDIKMPEVDGLAVLQELGRWDSIPAVAMLTTFDADDSVAEALTAGAVGYLAKSTVPAELISAIRALGEGRPALSASITQSVIDGFMETHDQTARALVDSLSDRQRDVLILIADGLSNSEIGQHLHLSAFTVKDLTSAVLQKLQVDNRVQAAVIAHRSGRLT